MIRKELCRISSNMQNKHNMQSTASFHEVRIVQTAKCIMWKNSHCTFHMIFCLLIFLHMILHIMHIPLSLFSYDFAYFNIAICIICKHRDPAHYLIIFLHNVVKKYVGWNVNLFNTICTMIWLLASDLSLAYPYQSRAEGRAGQYSGQVGQPSRVG